MDSCSLGYLSRSRRGNAYSLVARGGGQVSESSLPPREQRVYSRRSLAKDLYLARRIALDLSSLSQGILNLKASPRRSFLRDYDLYSALRAYRMNRYIYEYDVDYGIVQLIYQSELTKSCNRSRHPMSWKYEDSELELYPAVLSYEQTIVARSASKVFGLSLPATVSSRPKLFEVKQLLSFERNLPAALAIAKILELHYDKY